MDELKDTGLPVWLNPFQLKAWVQYRTTEAIEKASDWNGLAAQHVYGDEALLVGTVSDVIEKLQTGQIVAQGQRRGEAFEPIAAVEWTQIVLAPLNLSRQHPYLHIQFCSDEVLKHFPTKNVVSRVGTATSIIGAENECRDWLEKEFVADPGRRRDKRSFREATLLEFRDRLSARGFNDRIWPDLARKHGRSQPGAKPKS